MEQFVRDCAITMIYEGTNEIQALDLLGRKVLAEKGARMKKLASWSRSSSRRKASTRQCRSSSIGSLRSAKDEGLITGSA